MKLLRTDTRVPTGDQVGHGMDAVIVMVLFLAAGFGLDRLVGTMPVFMVIMSVLGGVGLFAKFKYRYDARMNEHEAQRAAAVARRTPDIVPPAVGKDAVA